MNTDEVIREVFVAQPKTKTHRSSEQIELTLSFGTAEGTSNAATR